MAIFYFCYVEEGVSGLDGMDPTSFGGGQLSRFATLGYHSLSLQAPLATSYIPQQLHQTILKNGMSDVYREGNAVAKIAQA